jgi:AraC-like DNA-binding protein
MNFTFDIINLLMLLAIAQGYIYTLMLLRRAWVQERYSDYWLAALLYCCSCYLLIFVIFYQTGFHSTQSIAGFLSLIYYAFGAVMYFYLKSQINTDFRVKIKDLWHFLPLFLYFLWRIYLYSQSSPVENVKVKYPFIYYSFITYRSVATIVYWVLSWQLYRKYRQWLPTERSDTEGVSFKWFQHFLLAIATMVFTAIPLDNMTNFGISVGNWANYTHEFIVVVCTYYVSIAGYMQYQPSRLIFIEKKEVVNPESEPATPLQAISKMTEGDIQTWKSKILNLMQSEKLYLNPELSLTDMATKLNTHNPIISAILNNGFQKNFNDFVNEYRVTIFKEKVKDPQYQHMSLLGIAYECGFNSKSTFNRAVKKITNQMPSEFISKE